MPIGVVAKRARRVMRLDHMLASLLTALDMPVRGERPSDVIACGDATAVLCLFAERDHPCAA
jgi:hypothetical protein